MYFKNSSKPVFSFQVTLLNGRFVNKLKIMEPINKTKFFFSFFFSYEPTSLSNFFLFLSFSLSLNKIVLFYYGIITFKKKTNTCTKYTIMFFHILKYVIWNMVPNTFFELWILKIRVFTTLFKLQFSHQYLNTLT